MTMIVYQRQMVSRPVEDVSALRGTRRPARNDSHEISKLGHYMCIISYLWSLIRVPA